MSGFTLPVWVAAAARAATEVLLGKPFVAKQVLNLPEQETPLSVPVTSASLIAGGEQALAISHCESGLALDFTEGLEIWICVQWQPITADDCGNSGAWLELIPGAGVGVFKSGGQMCLSGFATDLLHLNLHSLVPNGRCLRVEVVFPRGRELAKRTNNKAFGVVEGLAIIGTQSESQQSASPEQLRQSIDELRRKCVELNNQRPLTLVIGENGLELAIELGISAGELVKVGNWLGPLLVAAAEKGIQEILVLGYHGKLVKLAGGIFHTHHHLADGRIEILTALAVRAGLPLDLIQVLDQSESVEAAFLMLESNDSNLAQMLWNKMAEAVEVRSAAYIERYGPWSMAIGAALFDRQRRLRWAGPIGSQYLTSLQVDFEAD